MDNKEKIKNFLDSDGRVKSFPAKRKLKAYVLLYLSEKFKEGRAYTEKEVGEVLNQWHTFGDAATLRREMYDYHFLDRDPVKGIYCLSERRPDAEKLEERFW